MDHVKVRNVKGKERLFSMQVWNLMRTPEEKGDTRKGWTVVERINGPTPTVAPGSTVQTGGPQPTFQPEELKAKEEAAFKAEAERATGMISGEAPKAAQEAPAPAPVPVAAATAAPAAEAPKAAPEPAQAETAPPAPEKEAAPAAPPTKKDNLAQIQGTGEKVVAILNGIGIHTFAQLASASIGAVNKALDEGGMGPKKAMVPTWKMKAAELAKA